jgi:hypothetical protein
VSLKQTARSSARLSSLPLERFFANQQAIQHGQSRAAFGEAEIKICHRTGVDKAKGAEPGKMCRERADRQNFRGEETDGEFAAGQGGS